MSFLLEIFPYDQLPMLYIAFPKQYRGLKWMTVAEKKSKVIHLTAEIYFPRLCFKK